MLRIRVLAPLSKILGLTETNNSVVLELPVKPDTNLQTLFIQLSTRYPAFDIPLDPNLNSKLMGMIVRVHGKLIPASEYPQTPLTDNAEVVLFLPIVGG